MKYSELIDGMKIVDCGGNMIMQYRRWDGEDYLCSKSYAWPMFQFDLETFRPYNGDKEVGEYDN